MSILKYERILSPFMLIDWLLAANAELLDSPTSGASGNSRPTSRAISVRPASAMVEKKSSGNPLLVDIVHAAVPGAAAREPNPRDAAARPRSAARRLDGASGRGAPCWRPRGEGGCFAHQRACSTFNLDSIPAARWNSPLVEVLSIDLA